MLQTFFLNLARRGGVVVVDARVGVGKGTIKFFVKRVVVTESLISARDRRIMFDGSVSVVPSQGLGYLRTDESK